MCIFRFFVCVCVCSFVFLCPFLMVLLVCMGSMLVASIGHTLCFVLYYSYLLYFVSKCCCFFCFGVVVFFCVFFFWGGACWERSPIELLI